MFSETHSDSQRADRILASIRREEARPGRGLLKIFFGMAPGVGKTCAMLEAAIQAADKGVQVIIGVAESHGREDTMRLIGRLPRLPMKKMVYRGVEMEEFDLEEALRVKPQLILVDELAHTNVPGMRHRKRYQDVEDLLAAGIDDCPGRLHHIAVIAGENFQSGGRLGIGAAIFTLQLRQIADVLTQRLPEFLVR